MVSSFLYNFYQSQASPRIFASDSRAFLSSSSKAEVTVESISITATICSLSAHPALEVRPLQQENFWGQKASECYLFTDSYGDYYLTSRVSIAGNVVWERMHILQR